MLVLGNADAHIGDRQRDLTLFALDSGNFRLNGDVALAGEFDGVVAEVVEYLPDSPGVPFDLRRNVGWQVDDQLEVFFLGARANGFERLGNCDRQIEGNGFNGQFACLDFRKIENVVQNDQQGIGGTAHDVEVIPLCWVERRVQRQFSHADDAIHRCPDFVTHIGQEITLGTAGGFGGGLGFLQILFCPLAVGDIENGPDQP